MVSVMKTLHTAYRVQDLDRSVDFYRRLGFREIGRVTTGGGTTLVMLNLPGDGDVVDAHVVVGGIARGDAIVTSDPDDLRALAATIGGPLNLIPI